MILRASALLLGILLFLPLQGDFGRQIREDSPPHFQVRAEYALAPATAESLFSHAARNPVRINDTTVVLFFEGTAGTVSLAGDLTYWQPSRSFVRLPGRNLWYHIITAGTNARLDYKLVVDSVNWMLDPRNPDTCMSGYGPNSELKMPQYVSPPELEYHTEIAAGRLTDTSICSWSMRQVRPVTIYFPAGYAETEDEFPVIFFHDGPDFIALCQAPSILDFLIATGAIEPVVAVFINPVDRDPEYSGDLRDSYTSFVALELLPAMEKSYRVSKRAEDHALAGISNGGNIALYIGMHHPDKFMKVASLSGNVIPQIMKKFMESPPMNLEIYLDIGRYDIPVLIEMNETFAGILKQKGYDFSYHRWPEGHSWGNWAGHLRYPLTLFFPGSGR